jgi:hypothetical protein
LHFSSKPFFLIDINFNAYWDCQLLNPPKLFSSGTCVQTCPANTATVQNGSECINWKNNNLFYHSGFVVNKCPNRMAPDDNNICKVCHEVNQFYFYDICVMKCPEYYLIDSNKECYLCSVKNQVYLKGACVDPPCPKYNYLDKKYSACINCKDSSLFYIINDDK